MTDVKDKGLTDYELLELKQHSETMDVRASQLIDDIDTLDGISEIIDYKPLNEIALEMLYITVNAISKRQELEVCSFENIIVRQQVLPEYIKTLKVTLESRLGAVFGEIIDSSSLMVKELLSNQSGNSKKCEKLNDGLKLGNFELEREFHKPLMFRNLSTLKWEDERELVDHLRDMVNVYKSITMFKPTIGEQHNFSDEIFSKVNGFEKIKGTERLSIFGLTLIKTNGYEVIRIPSDKNQKVYKPLSEDGVNEVTAIVRELASKYNNIEETIIQLGKFIKNNSNETDKIVQTNLKNTLKTLHALLAVKASVVAECAKYVSASVLVPKKESKKFGADVPSSRDFMDAVNGGKDGNILGSILGTAFF